MFELEFIDPSNKINHDNIRTSLQIAIENDNMTHLSNDIREHALNLTIIFKMMLRKKNNKRKFI